ncbi:hypothetical protein [Kushneria indalinina]|uniref:Uncharacterized protein n=1 Tax=Kushneria indalinina DSM 14324 TaxID=1122140 RepID=A0A3D9DT99_9GAMM|nr:hypothetical protein [Kushneria indalinina]REC93952.1 hypothetical protein C8D72_2316 [Kushneria indalinina DSM 14324]
MIRNESKKRRPFDLRHLIAFVLGVYGILLGGKGLLDNAQTLEKADGLAINAWMGVAMLALGALIWLWSRLDPLPPVSPDDDTDE